MYEKQRFLIKVHVKRIVFFLEHEAFVYKELGATLIKKTAKKLAGQLIQGGLPTSLSIIIHEIIKTTN